MSVRKSPIIRLSRRGWVLAAFGALLVSSYMADSVASIGRVRSGVKAGSVQLGGRNEEEARNLLAARAQLLVAQPVELYADTRRVEVEPAEISFRPDREATLDDAMGVGRRGNVLIRFWHRLRALFASTDVGWESSYDRENAVEIVDDWADDIDTAGHEAGIEARGDTIVPVGAVPSRRLDKRRTIQAVVDGLEAWPRRAVELPIAQVSRRTDIADARAAAEEANEWASKPIRVAGPDGTGVTLSRLTIAKLLEAVPKRRTGSWRLQVQFAPKRVEDELSELLERYEREPESATFAVSGTSASVVAGREGRTFDAEATAEELGKAARRDEQRTARAKFKTEEPELTTEEAKDLKITELVSSFTTNHPCCQARVRNIHRIADTVDGAIVRPGATFSLNGYVGPRTTAKGYEQAPMIFDGEFKDAVGGGVSQFATTMFNAIFFGGYRFESYKAHSYYISRYPAGREATVSWPSPDLRFTNNSGAGILIKTSYSSNSITVSFYGDDEGKEVRAESGPRRNPTNFTERYVENPALDPGEQHVAQSGAPGFDITVTRIITKDGDTTRQQFSTRYKAQPKIIEVSPGGAPCRPSEGPDATPCPTQRPERTPGPRPTGTPTSNFPGFPFGDSTPPPRPSPTPED